MKRFVTPCGRLLRHRLLTRCRSGGLVIGSGWREQNGLIGFLWLRLAALKLLIY
jgi:hypothetical protein